MSIVFLFLAILFGILMCLLGYLIGDSIRQSHSNLDETVEPPVPARPPTVSMDPEELFIACQECGVADVRGDFIYFKGRLLCQPCRFKEMEMV
jgi:hypothetical protein